MHEQEEEKQTATLMSLLLQIYKLMNSKQRNPERKIIPTASDPPIMAFVFDLLRFLMVLLFVGVAPTWSLAGDITPTPAIDKVCKATKFYDFCVSTMYTDPNANFYALPDLASLIFRLTDDKAEIFQSYLKAQTKNAAATKLCLSDYAVVHEQILRGLNDMNTDEYQNLKQYAVEMAKSVLHCEAALAPSIPALLKSNHLVKSLIDICFAVGSFFSSSG